METLTNWSEILAASFQNLWAYFIDFLPRFIGALIVLVVGWIIALILGNLVVRIIDFLRIDHLIEKLGLKKGFQKADLELNVAKLVGWLVKWFLIAVFLIAAADILHWTQITAFLNRVVVYLPNVIIAVIILLVGMIVANFTSEVVHKAVRAAKLISADFLAGLAKWAILIFTFMAALIQLGIAAALIETLFTGFVAMLAIALGLAFGLGGREQASKFIDRLRKEISERE